jgi:hypothetical protein
MRIQDETADRGEALKDNLPGVPVSGGIVNSKVQELHELQKGAQDFPTSMVASLRLECIL